MSLRRRKSAQAKLVRRTPKGVELTSVGAALLSHVSKLRLARDDLARVVADLAHGRAGHLRIGASPSNAEVCLPDACSALLMEAPKVTLNVAVLDNDALLPALRKGDLDIAVTHTRQFSQPDLTLEPIREDELSRCASTTGSSSEIGHPRGFAEERWAAATSAAGALGLVARGVRQRGLPHRGSRSFPTW
jgi:DNA-binding transcriptional LysR family regulator